MLQLNTLWNRYSNCYLLGDDDHLIIIDPSVSSKDIISMIKKYYINVSDVSIFITHGHYDHFIYLRELIKDLSINNITYKLYIHKLDQNKLNDVDESCARMFGITYFESIVESIKVNDGDRFTVGDMNIKIIHTPGHTNGSVCIKVYDYLFTGDTLFLNGVGRTDLPTGYVISFYESIKKLMKIEEDLALYPGHGDESKLQYEKKYNYYYNQIK